MAFRRNDSPAFGCQFKLRGLDPKTRYSIRNFDSEGEGETVSGEELMNSGLRVVIDKNPGSAVIVYRRE